VARLVSSLSDQGPVVEAIIEAALEAFSEGMSSSHRRLRRGAVWYRDHPHAAGNPKLGMVLLSRHFHAGGDARTHAEHHLVRALLADLDDAYTGIAGVAGVVPRPQRAGRPVVLLDNVQEAAGRRLMESVLRARADGRADQVAFFAGLRGQGHPALRNAARRTLAEATRGTDWAPGGTPSSHALLVSLPPLSPDDTRQAVEAACTGLSVPPALPFAVHRLTGGNPLGTALLAASAGRNLPRGLATPADLLLAEDTGRRAYETVLDRLLPDEDHLDELAVLSLAQDHDSAVVLAESQLPVGFGKSGVRALSSRLAAQGHAPAPDHFVSDPFLRALLLLHLRHGHTARSAERWADRPAWREAHRTLAAHYGDARPLHRAHHELALGNADFAVTHLHDTYDATAPRDWLAALIFIASAPRHTPDAPSGATHVSTAAGPAGADPDLRLRVRRVLHAARRTTDPFSPPTPETVERLRRDLASLLPESVVSVV
jgi:hypothetical protein